jgi:uracil-DNA glycosylase
MQEIIFKPNFRDWQNAARTLLRKDVRPDALLWVESDDPQSSLGFSDHSPETNDSMSQPFRVPRKFVELAQHAALHSDQRKWPLLYRIVWRLTHGEPKLLELPTDLDVIQLCHFEREVQKDAYRMRAFLRFRQTTLNGQPWFVSWYEPEHDSIELNQEFFVNRYANMQWSILTPRRCMHWDGEKVRFSAGATKAAAPTNDDLEQLWIAYYSNIFNPARLKPSAMQAQLLKRNWKNLPEAAVIEPLMRAAPKRTAAMIDRSDFLRVRESDYSLAQPPPGADLEEVRNAAASCRACPLWKDTTCTVFGEGLSTARIILVGEQPGDQEDRAGRPFVGPAGQVLDRALVQAGVDRQQLYVTNAVKHFKFEPRGKRRIHKTPNSREIAACRPWLEAELRLLRPELIVSLGGTAARSLFNSPVRITQERGRILDSEFGKTLVTIHPSALLRLADPADFESEFERFVTELRLIPKFSKASDFVFPTPQLRPSGI